MITNSLVEFAERHPELSAIFKLHLARLETNFESALARASTYGELSPERAPASTSSMLVAVVQGMNVMAKAVMAKANVGRATLQAVVDTTLAGLACSQPAKQDLSAGGGC